MTQNLAHAWPFGLHRSSRAVILALLLVVVLLVVYPFDYAASEWGRGLPVEIRRAFRWLTRWGESDWILIPAFVGLLLAWLVSLVTRERVQAVARELATLSGFVFSGVALPSLVATLLKRGFGRGRPEAWTAEAPLSFVPLNWDAYDHQSFPSGHATTAFSLALTVALLWPRLLWPMLVLAAGISLSRVIVGAHYPTDVLAGAVLGTLGAYAVRNMFAARGWLFERAEDGTIRRRPLEALAGLVRR